MNLFASLRYLVALDDHRHFGRAALACHVTQPALSNALKALEDHYGVAIVKRGRTFAGFTPEGERVLAAARQVLHEQELLVQDLASTADHPQGNILIGTVPTAVPLAARFAARLQQLHPGIRPTVRSMSSIEIETGLEQLALDLGLGYTERMAQASSRMRIIPQYGERYYLLRRAPSSLRTTREQTLTWGKPIRWANAAVYPLCLLGTDMHNRTLIDRAFQSAGCSVEPVIETNSIMTLTLAVLAGDVCSVMPGSLVALSEGFKGLEACPLVDPDMVTSVSFMTPLAQRNSRTVQAAIDLAQSPAWLADVAHLSGDVGRRAQSKSRSKSTVKTATAQVPPRSGSRR